MNSTVQEKKMKVLIVIVLASLACSQVSAADPAVLVVTNQINTLLGTIQTFVSDVVNAKFDDITNGAAVMKAQSDALKVLIQIFPTYLLIGNSLFEILVNIVTTIAAAVADAIQKITDALGANVINAITNVLGQILGSSKPTSTLVAIATALFNGLSKAFGDFKTNLLAALATLNTLQAKDIQAQFVAALNSLLLLIGKFNTFAQLFPLVS